MNTPLPPKPSQTNGWRKQRLWMLGMAACATLIGLFYTEELWRGKRDWEEAKRAFEAKGVKMDWASHIPAPVPDDQNVFAVKQMQKWFVGRGEAGWNDMCKKMSSATYAGLDIDSNTPRMLVAEVTIGLPGTPTPAGASVLQWDDPASRAEAAKLLTNALGPTASEPTSRYGVGLMLRRPEEVQPARIFLQCQTAPTERELKQFLPDAILHAHVDAPETNTVLKFEPDGEGSYRVTLPTLVNVADFLAWSDQLEPQFTLIRQALQRPYARMQANYVDPNAVPIPCFISVRHFAQILSARAECHYLLGQPEEALSDLTLMHESCRPIMEENEPMTLVAAMINGAVRGLYANTVSDGLRMRAWHEPQLAALEEQLKAVNILPPVQETVAMERVFSCHTLENTPKVPLVQMLMGIDPGGKSNSWRVLESRVLGALLPRGWLYQNMASGANLTANSGTLVDPANEIIFSDKVEVFNKKAHGVDHWSPSTFIIALNTPNWSRAWQTTANHQTEINQALVVCDLERFRLAHGQYPETLDALVPLCIEKIPHDVIGGQPPHYRRAADGTFALYSVGWSGKNGGGVRGKTAAEGDWVWPD